MSSYDTHTVHAVLHLRKRNMKLLAQITKSPSQDNPAQGKAPVWWWKMTEELWEVTVQSGASHHIMKINKPEFKPAWINYCLSQLVKGVFKALITAVE